MTRELVAAYGLGLATGGLIWLLATYWFEYLARRAARHARARHSYRAGGPVTRGETFWELAAGEQLISPADLDRARAEPVEWIDGPRTEYVELPGWRDKLKRIIAR